MPYWNSCLYHQQEDATPIDTVLQCGQAVQQGHGYFMEYWNSYVSPHCSLKLYITR